MTATKHRFRWLVLVGIATVFLPQPLPASFCPTHAWMLAEIANAPVLVVGRVVSLDMENGPHFTGDPKQSAPEQNMTAEVTILRSMHKPGMTGPAGHLKIRFVGRDGPDFSPCARELPQLEPGQVLLLPLRGNANGSPMLWQLMGTEGYGMTFRVSGKMREPAPAASDGRSFIIRELVNSLNGSDSIAEYTAASLITTQTSFLEPEFSVEILNSLGNDTTRWAQFLASVLIAYPGGSPLTLAEVRAGTANPPCPRFQGFPIAQLALRHLPEATAEGLVWRSVFASLPSLTDEPYHQLFDYHPSSELHRAVSYLSRYDRDLVFLNSVKASLREDRPGSSYLASTLIRQGQMACLPEALDRAMKVIRRPESSGDDVFAAILLLLEHGTASQRRQYALVATHMKKSYPDYAAFLELKLAQESRKK